ncbi:MAG TPA: FadR/GntR family transcriptional regulator [Candidatus Sulfotelmatobacter sp.]|nr:FadR/GntR family transcriptional regulator [Candidatus Sulfotelmatobacter sp.]
MLTSQHLRPIPRPSLTEEIVKRLVNLILEERLRPGDKLPSERELVGRFSVGRSSLREAIRILNAIGVVEVSVGEGMFVGKGDLSLIARPLSLGLLMGRQSRDELIEARRVLETELAGLAAERATEGEVNAIRRQLETMRRSQMLPERYARADLAFHLAIAQAAHNQLLYNLLHTLRHIVGSLISKVVLDYDANHMPQSFKVHIPIFEAVRDRDPRAARTAMAVHLDRLEERLTAAISRGHGRRPSSDGGTARSRQRSRERGPR